jgi:hypothetical protein
VASDELRDILDLKVDLGNLYREEIFTDLGAATVRRLSPVTADGAPDPGRPTVYMGETSLMTQVGPVPVQFELEAQTLEEAFRRFVEGVQGAVERLQERAQEVLRSEASRIVVPTAVPPGMNLRGTPGAGPGGARGSRLIFDK